MAQVVIFFGWLIIGITTTVVIFGHVSIAFVYGFNTFMETLFPEDGLSSLLYFLVSPIPGSIVIYLGKLMKKSEDREAARDEAENN
ncbi:MAG: hypothetical protein KAI28_05680 [Sphingomonadales bacterium]|nr:hypothetical protein [Sphingomonadales bacterium]